MSELDVDLQVTVQSNVDSKSLIDTIEKKLDRHLREAEFKPKNFDLNVYDNEPLNGSTFNNGRTR